MKYRIRKLIFLLVLASMVLIPMAYAEYESINTTDPFILIAREVEAYKKSVDVLGVEEHKQIRGRAVIFAHIPDFPDWSIRVEQENFKVAVIRAASRYGFDSVVIIIGWDFPPPDFRVQGVWECEELRRSSCVWIKIPSVVLDENFRPWPGIGNP